MRLSFVLAALLLCPTLLAQPVHVSAEYEVTTQIQRTLPPELARLAGDLPTSSTVIRQLRYDGVRAQSTDAEQDEQTGGTETPRVRVRRNSMGLIHVDTERGVGLSQRDFMDRQFLVTEEPLDIEWTLTQEAAEFLGYPAYKATASVAEKAVEAWFTPSIAAPVGPERYGGLPGLILVLTEDGGRRTFVAREVSLEPLDAALVPPTEGQPMTREEYDALVREKMEALRSNRQPGTIFIPAN